MDAKLISRTSNKSKIKISKSKSILTLLLIMVQFSLCSIIDENFNSEAEIVWQIDDIDYTEGGDNWEGLCSNGTYQSPINIEMDKLSELQTTSMSFAFPNLTEGLLSYQHGKLEAGYTTGTIEYETNRKMSKYKTIEFNFHAPAEHSINDEEYDAEMHFKTHLLNDNNELLYLAVLLSENNDTKDNEFFEQLKLGDINKNTTTMRIENADFIKLLEYVNETHIFKYHGSRTKPPCEEDVEWLVLRNSVPINPKQLDYFRNLWQNNPEFAEGRGNNRNRQSMFLINPYIHIFYINL